MAQPVVLCYHHCRLECAKIMYVLVICVLAMYVLAIATDINVHGNLHVADCAVL